MDRKVGGETLMVPVLSEDGRPMSLQRIEPDEKRFLKGGKTAGGYFPVKGNDGPLYLAEGLATALSVHEATGGGTVLACFTASNLEPVARMARQMYPKRAIVICGDDDAQTEAKRGTNPGRESAFQAARSVGGKVALPVFQAGDSSYTSDRIGRGLNLYVPAVCMSLIGSTQPARVGPYVKGTLDGSGDDGLLQRFGLLVWPDTSGTWKEVDRWPDTDAKNQAFKVFERLDKLDPGRIPAAGLRKNMS